MIGIYALLNKTTGRVYVGQTNDIKVRCTTHFYRLRRGIHKNKYLQNSYRKHGRDAFTSLALKECFVEDLTGWEQYFIDYYRTVAGVFNSAGPADSPVRGRRHTESAKKAIADAKRGKSPLSRDARLAIAAKLGHPVESIDPVTGEVREYPSVRAAALALGLAGGGQILKAIRDNQRMSGRLYWRRLPPLSSA